MASILDYMPPFSVQIQGTTLIVGLFQALTPPFMLQLLIKYTITRSTHSAK